MVEHVDNDQKRKIWEIRDPASSFRKMQMDHGWRSFALSHNQLEPEEGMFLLHNGQKMKITGVKSAGLIKRISVLELDKPITYNPRDMEVLEDDPTDGLPYLPQVK